MQDIRQVRNKEGKEARCNNAREYIRNKATKQIASRSPTEIAGKYASELQEHKELRRRRKIKMTGRKLVETK